MPLAYAGPRVRALALAADWVLICAWLIVVVLVRRQWMTPIAPWPVLIYFAALEAGPAQASWGKQQAGLKVMRASGARLSVLRSLARSGLKLAPWAAAWWIPPEWCYFWCAAWALAAALPLLIAPRHRAWYDLAAGTAVIRVPAPAAPSGSA